MTIKMPDFIPLPAILRSFLKDETISGKLILFFALLAVAVVNSPWHYGYEQLWQTNVSIGLGSWSLSQDLRHWINEALMAFFFLTVGLEVKRELVVGELRDRKKAALPIGAALGGMVVPALIYVAFNMSPDVVRGWGIPIATDIAFAVSVLVLLGRRVPLSLKLFLLTLAIVDDIGAIFVIALFYAEIIHYGYLLASIVLVIGLWLLRKWLAGRLLVFLGLGIVLWVTTHLSGIHASIVGAALGLLAPLPGSTAGPSVAGRLEKLSLPIATFVALPVFAFANAGVVLSVSAFAEPTAITVAGGIIAGLLIGKVVGITGAAWLLVRLGIAKLPKGVGWWHMCGVGLVASIGFTVSIFITELAFGGNQQLVEAAKISIFIASACGAFLGTVMLLRARGTSNTSEKL